MKKITLCFLLVLVAGFAFGQTWTVVNDDGDEIEYTVITRQQFDRILKANETTAAGAILQFDDVSEINYGRIIKGSRPELKGYYYVSTKITTKSERGKLTASHIRSIIKYGNSETGIMTIIYFYSEFSALLFPGVIELKPSWKKYKEQFNQLIGLVNGE